MKVRRQRKIQELVSTQIIRTQEELVIQLSQFGLNATQATISRDIKEIGLIKVPGPGDEYHYALANESQAAGLQERLKRICRDIVVSFGSSETIVLIKTLPGNAQTLATLIDNTAWPEVLGTVAGDDTVLLVVRQKKDVEAIKERLDSFMT